MLSRNTSPVKQTRMYSLESWETNFRTVVSESQHDNDTLESLVSVTSTGVCVQFTKIGACQAERLAAVFGYLLRHIVDKLLVFHLRGTQSTPHRSVCQSQAQINGRSCTGKGIQCKDCAKSNISCCDIYIWEIRTS